MKDTCFINADEDNYEKQCGEVFLTVKGNIIFHCTLCDSKCNKYNSFQEYAAHIERIHINSHFLPTKLLSMGEISLDPLEIALGKKKPEDNVHAAKTLSNEPVNKNENPKETHICRNESTNHIKTAGTVSTVEPNSSFDFCKILESVDLQIKKKRYKRENRKFKCPNCDFAANDSTHLAYHVRRHSTNKPHKCSDCERAFYTKSELKTHQRTHTGELPFLCPFCGRAFMTSGMLSDHVKRHQNLRDKECTVCSMKFYSAKQLRAHIVVHSEDRLYVCSECNKGFKQRVALKTHMKLHANKREYHCEFCTSSFNQSSGLYSHMKNKHSSLTPVPDLQNHQPKLIRDDLL